MDGANIAGHWLALAGDVHTAMFLGADEAQRLTDGVTGWSAEAVAVRLLLRSCRNLQGIIVLCEQRLVVESRTLARSLLENSFGVAALQSPESAQTYLQMLWDDSEESRRRQGKFILDKLSSSPGDVAKLRQAIDAMDRSLKTISPKQVAELGAMLPQYLYYQRLSDDSAHATAKSLHHHVTIAADKSWTFRYVPGTDGEIAATIQYALIAALAVGVGVADLVGAVESKVRLMQLSERWRALPTAESI
ncbi:DUF5677 domain-containing protein (plasmid) [Cupriavidus sp. H18C2]